MRVLTQVCALLLPARAIPHRMTTLGFDWLIQHVSSPR